MAFDVVVDKKQLYFQAGTDMSLKYNLLPTKPPFLPKWKVSKGMILSKMLSLTLAKGQGSS